MTTIVLTGIACDNTCLNWSPGDTTPDYLGLFGPAFGDLMGVPFVLDIDGSNYSLTMNGHTVSFAAGDPHYSLEFNPPEFPGTIRFEAAFVNAFGFAVPMTVYECPVPIPGVPEPATWALLLIGMVAAVLAKRFWRPSLIV